MTIEAMTPADNLESIITRPFWDAVNKARKALDTETGTAEQRLVALVLAAHDAGVNVPAWIVARKASVVEAARKASRNNKASVKGAFKALTGSPTCYVNLTRLTTIAQYHPQGLDALREAAIQKAYAAALKAKGNGESDGESDGDAVTQVTAPRRVLEADVLGEDILSAYLAIPDGEYRAEAKQAIRAAIAKVAAKAARDAARGKKVG